MIEEAQGVSQALRGTAALSPESDAMAPLISMLDLDHEPPNVATLHYWDFIHQTIKPGIRADYSGRVNRKGS